MKKTKLYAKKTLSVVMAVLMLMSAWVFVAPAEAGAVAASTIKSTNETKIKELESLDFGTGFTTVSGNFHGDNAATTASKGYFKNTLYSPHYAATNDACSNNGDYAVSFGTLGGKADGARVWYPDTTLIYDGVTTPQIGVLFDLDSATSKNWIGMTNGYKVKVYKVYISSGADGLSFPDSKWTAKSTANSEKYYTHFTLNWIIDNNTRSNYVGTTSGTSAESVCKNNGDWDIYGTYLQYTGGAFASGNTYYKAITPTWAIDVDATDATAKAVNTIYVIDYVPLKNALSSVKGIIDEIKANPSKYTTASVASFVDAAKDLILAKPNNYIDSGKNDVTGWNSKVSSALNTWNTAKNLKIQKYTVTFVDKDKKNCRNT